MTRTNAYSVLCVLVRAFALWLFADTLYDIPQFFITAKRYALDDQVMTITLASSGFLLAVAAVLWIFADKLARLALARPQQITFESDIPVVEWQVVAFSTVGLWQAVTGLVYLAHRIIVDVYAYFQNAANGAHIPLSSDIVVWQVADCLRVVIGIALLFGARGLVGLLRRYRQIGYTHADAIEPSDSDTSDAAKPDPLPPA